MARTNDVEEWDLAARVVREHADELKAMTSHKDMLQLSKDNGIDSGSKFNKFKSELRKQLHIDYAAVREEAIKAELTAVESAAADAPTVELYASGDIEVNSYAVCADIDDGWYGTFHEKDKVEDQDDADFSAACKAMFLAGQLRESKGLDVVNLTLTVSNHAVTAASLGRDVLRHRVWVTIEIVDAGEDNPALELCRAPGFRGWREVALDDLLVEAGAE